MIEAALGFIAGIGIGWLTGVKSRFWKPSPVSLPESRIYWSDPQWLNAKLSDDVELTTWSEGTSGGIG